MDFYWMTFFFPWWHILSVIILDVAKYQYLLKGNTHTHTFRMVSCCHYSFADKVSIVLGHLYEVDCSLAALATINDDYVVVWYTPGNKKCSHIRQFFWSNVFTRPADIATKIWKIHIYTPWFSISMGICWTDNMENPRKILGFHIVGLPQGIHPELVDLW